MAPRFFCIAVGGEIGPRTDMDMMMKHPTGHFYIVTFVALIALMVAVLIGVSSIQLRNIEVTLLALAFISLAEVFAVHGLSTPGLLMGASHVSSIAAEISVVLTAFWIWLSSIPSDHRVILFLSRMQRALVPLWTISIGVVFFTAMMVPEMMTNFPVDDAPLKWILASLAIFLSMLAIRRFWKSFRYSQSPLQISIVYSLGQLSVAQLIMVTGQIWKMSWWLYHFTLLTAVVVMVAGVLRQYASGPSIPVAIRGLFTSNPIERIEVGISATVRSLIVATEAKDAYTAGHNFRVAVYALRLGEQIGLPPEQLRALAQGAVIHDVGKIEIPDSVLNNPGKLTPEERKLIEKHPVTGYEMCKRLGFMKDELDIIRYHHEKWDGSGYPEGKVGYEIPSLARIVAIADVYDALTTSRAYRSAWSHEDAMQFIAAHAAKHFDPDYVQVWLKLNENAPVTVQCPSWVYCENASVQPNVVSKFTT